jgi:hypothetical protein
MRDIAAQLDAAGIDYEMPIPPSPNPPQYGLSESEMLRRIADLHFMLQRASTSCQTGK